MLFDKHFWGIPIELEYYIPIKLEFFFNQKSIFYQYITVKDYYSLDILDLLQVSIFCICSEGKDVI